MFKNIVWPGRSIFPLRPCQFDRHKFLCPANGTAYLEEYGASCCPGYKSWRVPDKKWDGNRFVPIDTRTSL